MVRVSSLCDHAIRHFCSKTSVLARFACNSARCARKIAKPNCRYRRFGQTDLRSEFRRSATMPSATFALKRVFERASRTIARFARTAPQKRRRRYRRLGQTNLRSEFRCAATTRSTTSCPQRFRTEGTPPCSSLSEPVSKREPPRFARRLTKWHKLSIFLHIFTNALSFR